MKYTEKEIKRAFWQGFKVASEIFREQFAEREINLSETEKITIEQYIEAVFNALTRFRENDRKEVRNREPAQVDRR